MKIKHKDFLWSSSGAMVYANSTTIAVSGDKPDQQCPIPSFTQKKDK